jgi:hypothetical protein
MSPPPSRSQPQENCNADILISQFLAEMDAETNEVEEEEGEETVEAEMDQEEEMEEQCSDAGIAPARPPAISCCLTAPMVDGDAIRHCPFCHL